MATNKRHWYSRPMEVASDEIIDIYCEPCLVGGSYFQANGFCIDCSEYLCGQCYKTHTRFKAFKHHMLQDKSMMPLDSRKSRAQDVCVERCDKHPTKIVEYFCRSCDMLGCNVCITVNHRQCENVDHIPDIARNLKTSEEYKQFLSKLESNFKCIDEYISKIQLKTNISDDITTQGKAELRRQRNEINKYFDQLETAVDRRMRYIDKSNRKSLQAAFCTADSIKDFLTKIETSIKSKVEANCELFIKMKQSKQSFENLDKQYEKLRQDSRIQPFFLTPPKQKENTIGIGRLRIANFVSKIDFGDDGDEIWIIGLATIQKHFLALLEMGRKTVCVVDTRNAQVVDKIVLQFEYVWRMINANTNQLAVLISSGHRYKIQVLSVDSLGNISKCTQVNIEKDFMSRNSFIFKNGKFFMLGYKEIVILDMVGNHLETLQIRFATYVGSDIAISPDCKIIYLTTKNNVTSLTLDGRVHAIYRDRNMTRPEQITVDNEGYIYVCCQDNIYQLSGDLSHGQIIIDDLGRSITFCEINQRLYLGHGKDVKVYEINS